MLVRYGKAGERNGKTVEMLVERIDFGFLPLTFTVSEHKMLIFIVVWLTSLECVSQMHFLLRGLKNSFTKHNYYTVFKL